MHAIRNCLATLLLLCASAATLAQPATPEPPEMRWKVLFIATGNVPAGKFVHLARIAAAHGIRVEHRYLHELPAEPDAGLWTGFDAVFVDSYLQDQVRARLAQALPGLRAPQAWLYDARAAWRGFPDALGQRLVDYYSSGAEQNFDRFFASLRLHLRGGDPLSVAPPVIFPKTALYHPQAPDLVFPSVADYLAWRGLDGSAAARPPLVAVAFHQQYLASMETGLVDDLIAGIERRGGVALAFYAPAMRGPGWRELLAPEGNAVFDVLLNTQITLDGEARRADFEGLDRPVLQLLTYRKGTPQQWADDPVGLSLTDVPFYLAQPEYAGAIDAQVVAATRQPEQQLVALPAQLDSVLDKAFNLLRLQRTPAAEQRLALMFWNYPPGEKNLSASFLNLPESLERVLASLAGAGYVLGELPRPEALLAQLQATLAPFYRDLDLAAMVAADGAATLSLRTYRQWYQTLPEAVRSDIESRWGQPEQSLLVLDREGEARFVIPRVELGQLVLLPQPARGERWEPAEKALYHSSTAAPSHHYLATYLWLRETWRSDALIHFGTHGSQEWLPGKERGLSVHDYPTLAVGAMPVVYPYIVDNIGEALQARRRGRATVVSHQTPPFRPAGLHQTLVDLHDRLHAWMNQDQGALREQLRRELIEASAAGNVLADLGWDTARAEADFPAYAEVLHAHLHELAQTAQPLGLHAFGRAPEEPHRLATVLLMLGRDFWEAAAAHAGAPTDQLDEALAGDYAALQDSAPYRLLQRHLVEAADPAALPEALQAQLLRAGEAYARIGAGAELPALRDGLRGDYLPTSYGGDPIRNPDAYPTGRNLYGFDPSRVPTRSAWVAAEQAASELFEAHRQRLGSAPQKLTFSLWSVETMRHQGLLEAQALWLLGVRPVWDQGGRVTGVELMPRPELGRPRVDVVLSATGLYRDHFPNLLQHLARAVELAAAAEELDNPVAAHSRAIQARLAAGGLDAEAARLAALTRIFSSASGNYGTGLDDASLASDTWEGKAEGDAKLAELYLSRMQYAYGPRVEDWGRADLAGAGVNLYAEQLRGTQGAVLSRSSNLYGMLTTDDPFQYLGGIALAVRHLDGAAPELSISNLRGGGSGRLQSAAGFLANELATRQFHPGYIEGLMAEGYAGTLEVTAAMNNFWGWTAVAREIVRDDQWQSFVDVYVRDRHQLGVREWFERDNPAALAQVIERMLEASRQGYWQADAATVDELKQRYVDLLQRFDLQTSNAALAEFVGYGLSAAAIPTQPPAPAPLQQIEGQRLARADSAAPLPDGLRVLAPLLITLLLGLGAWRQAGAGGRAPRLAAALGHARERDPRHHGRHRRSRSESSPHAPAIGAHHD
jgi:cobaltochelatase CobN